MDKEIKVSPSCQLGLMMQTNTYFIQVAYMHKLCTNGATVGFFQPRDDFSERQSFLLKNCNKKWRIKHNRAVSQGQKWSFVSKIVLTYCEKKMFRTFKGHNFFFCSYIIFLHHSKQC